MKAMRSALVAALAAFVVCGCSALQAEADRYLSDYSNLKAHPEVRGRGLRGVSMGLSSHYAAMAARYGDVPLGVAGENIIVATDRPWAEDELASGVVIRGDDGREVVFPAAPPAAPCLEFTTYLLQLPERATRDDVEDDLDFLGGGMRGFLIDASRIRANVPVRLGDEVSVLS